MESLGMIVKPKYWNTMLTKFKLTKKRFVFEQYRQTNQRMINAHKKQFKAFKFQRKRYHYEFLLSILNAFTVGINGYYPRCNNVNDEKKPSDPLSLLLYR